MDRTAITAFWNWFSEIARDLSADPENDGLLEQLDSKIQSLHPAIVWEIGPGKYASWQLVISPDLDIDLLPLTEAIVSEAPRIPGWEFHPVRLPKDWDQQFEIKHPEGSISVDARDWRYVLLKYPNGDVEILLHSDAANRLDEKERRQASSILLQGVLGEKPLLDKHLTFELSDTIEENLRDKLKPISSLPEAFGLCT